MDSDRTKSFLIGLLKAGGIVTVLLLAPGAAPLLKSFIKNERLDKRDFNRVIKRLKNRGLIDIKSKNGQIIIKLEPIGKTRAIEYSLDEMMITKPKKWDKKWRVVTFDIPETKKTARGVFKEKLDNLGFVQLQKSIYVHPYPCEEEIRYICSVYGLGQYVKFILADRVDGQTPLLNRYNLVPAKSYSV
jgi:DNA-binding transcriptional regulator PaaX